MGEYPTDFPVPQDQGDPVPAVRSAVSAVTPSQTGRRTAPSLPAPARAPVLLVHGNGGAADVQPWDMLDLNRMLLAAGYSPELIWAPSYLGPGTVCLFTPHTDNINDVRDFLEAVCRYLGVDVVDVIAHSLGCTLMYAMFRGLEHRSAAVGWNQPKEWNRVGTFVAPAGAFHGLGAASVGEWVTGGEFMNELLAEMVGGGGETPYRTGTSLTPPPLPHAITYFCGVATGDLVDAQNPGTGSLDGATNMAYDLGSGITGHRNIKESDAVFNDFLPLLNSLAPVASPPPPPNEPRRNPLVRWWSRLLAWWRRRSR